MLRKVRPGTNPFFGHRWPGWLAGLFRVRVARPARPARPTCRQTSLAIVTIVVSGLLGAVNAAAGDHFLTIGGGSSATNNQVSLEKNVLYFQRFLDAAGMGRDPHEILFSDGNAGARDLQYFDAGYKLPRVNEVLAEVFNLTDDVDAKYRAHAIPNLWGPSGRQGINNWFDAVGSKLPDGDRLIIYFTGHGGRGQGNPPTNQTLAMWNEPGLTVHDFNLLLDRLPPKTPVVLIMVQCFGGGFANVIFNDADPNRGLSPRNRCGFFATLPTRVAAGCTADADEENYKEYSTYFWSALYGRKRTGEKVETPNYEQTGRVSLADAHAYTQIHSETIDMRFIRTAEDVALAANLPKVAKAEVQERYKTLVEAEAGFLEPPGKQPR